MPAFAAVLAGLTLLTIVQPASTSEPGSEAARDRNRTSALLLAVQDLDGRPGDEVLSVVDRAIADEQHRWTLTVRRATDGRALWSRRVATIHSLNTETQDGFPCRPRRAGQGGIAVAELRDGRPVVVVLRGEMDPSGAPMVSQRLLALDAGSGRVLWRYPATGDSSALIYGFLVMADADGDGADDLAVLTGASMGVGTLTPVGPIAGAAGAFEVLTLSGASGEVIGSFTTEASTLLPLRDLSGDGDADIVLLDSVGLAARSATGDVHWIRRFDHGIDAINVIEVDRDRGPEIIVTHDTSFTTVDGSTGETLWTFAPDQGHTVVVDDMDGDGTDDLLWGGYPYSGDRHGVAVTKMISGKDLSVVWRTASRRDVGPDPSCADLTGDRTPDLWRITGESIRQREDLIYTYRVVARSGDDGATMWRWPEARHAYGELVIPASVLVGRGRGADLVTFHRAGTAGEMRLYRGSTGALRWRAAVPTFPGRWPGRAHLARLSRGRPPVIVVELPTVSGGADRCVLVGVTAAGVAWRKHLCERAPTG